MDKTSKRNTRMLRCAAYALTARASQNEHNARYLIAVDAGRASASNRISRARKQRNAAIARQRRRYRTLVVRGGISIMAT